MCISFVYGGCQGNDNRFDTLDECNNRCKGKKEDVCKLAPDAGDCEALIDRYFYNPSTKRCEIFTYGGCGGNNNNFLTLRDCQNACDKGSKPKRKYKTRY